MWECASFLPPYLALITPLPSDIGGCESNPRTMYYDYLLSYNQLSVFHLYVVSDVVAA